MSNAASKKLNRLVLATLVFLGLILILQYTPANEIHGRSDAPTIVAMFGALGLILSFILKLNFLGIVVALGYLVSFIIGLIFNTDGVDPSGGKTNNLWQIWLISYLVILIIAFIIDKKIGVKVE